MSKITVTTIAGATSGADANTVKIESGDELNVVNGDLTVDTNVLKVDSSNNRVGIGTASPSTKMHISGNASNASALSDTVTDFALKFDSATTGNYFSNAICFAEGNNVNASIASHDGGSGGAQGLVFGTGASNTERMRIDSSGRLGVGDVTDASLQSGNNTGNKQFYWQGNYGVFASDNDVALICNRQNSNDGPIIALRKNGPTIGNIGVSSTTGNIYMNGGNVGITFTDNGRGHPTNSSGVGIDNAMDWGQSTFRFDDIHATNGTIQTSDQNEKEQIASLTTAEITAAKAISKLFKTFKWQDKVAAKGDAARRHAGVIAQEVQTAMTNAGLDAADYAFWCSDTWWETQTEVPAVEAVDAVLDEDGNMVTEAVEAVAAYTRTDTYDTSEEAPEGATERTRMGIRYPELLAFVGAATEQRLADIETRLEVLENA